MSLSVNLMERMASDIQAEEDRRIMSSINSVAFMDISLVAEPTDPGATILTPNFEALLPNFTVIGFKPSKKENFTYPEEESLFKIYGIKHDWWDKNK